MWQELRDYWLPWVLFVGTLALAALLLLTVAIMPWLVDVLPSFPLFELYADDTTVRRVSLASGAGLIATAFIFFRPNPFVLARKSSAKKPTHDTMAGA
jgi:hypothetical protein